MDFVLGDVHVLVWLMRRCSAKALPSSRAALTSFSVAEAGERLKSPSTDRPSKVNRVRLNTTFLEGMLHALLDGGWDPLLAVFTHQGLKAVPKQGAWLLGRIAVDVGCVLLIFELQIEPWRNQ